MTKPSAQDATLMLGFSQWGATMGLHEAMNWMWSREFATDYAEFMDKYPPGSEGHGKLSKILNWYETLGTLYKYGLFNEDLLFDWIWAVGVWNRVKGYALGLRETVGVPALYENFEAMAEAQEVWPGAGTDQS